MSAKRLRSLSHVRLIGCGTALHAAQVGRLAIEHLARVPLLHVASEFRNNDPVIDPKAAYFAVSQSGETADTLAAVKAIQMKDAEVMGVINVAASSIARQCGQGVYIHSGARTISSINQGVHEHGCSTQFVCTPDWSST